VTCPASFTQRAFRGRNDNGDETTATWKATQGTDWTQAVDENFRVRFCAQEGAGCAGSNKVWQLQYNLAAAGWNAVNATSSVVRSSASPNVTDGIGTTEQLTGGTGTFQGGSGSTGGFDEVNGAAGGNSMDVAASGHSEAEFCIQIRSADVTNGQTLQLRITDAGSALASYTSTPTITVSELTQYTMNAEPGAYAITGADAINQRALVVNAAAGSYAITGADAALSKSYNLNAEPGSYTISGADTTDLRARVLNAEPGFYTVSGVNTTDVRTLILNAESGEYAISGAELAALRALSLHAEAGSYTINGADATFALSGEEVVASVDSSRLFLVNVARLMNP